MPKCIIFLMNGWDSSAGGIQTVNRELVSAIAKVRPELRCIVAVPIAAEHESEDAFNRRVGPRVHIGSIASGEKLVKDPSRFAETISHWSNVIAVDMESAGVFEAAQLAAKDVSVAVVRGIADFADGQKNDNYQREASRNAVAVALRLIDQLTIPSALDESTASQ